LANIAKLQQRLGVAAGLRQALEHQRVAGPAALANFHGFHCRNNPRKPDKSQESLRSKGIIYRWSSSIIAISSQGFLYVDCASNGTNGSTPHGLCGLLAYYS
jgi:hypothetical protein